MQHNVNDQATFDQAVRQFEEMRDNERSLFKIDHVTATDDHCYIMAPDQSILYFSPRKAVAYDKHLT